MKYCIQYAPSVPLEDINAADEIILPYDKRIDWDKIKKKITNTTIVILSDCQVDSDHFIDERSRESRCLPRNYEDFKVAISIIRIHTSRTGGFKIKFNDYDWLFDPQYEPHLRYLDSIGIPYFFSHICNTFDQIQRLIHMRASEIYIGGELGFSLNIINKICQDAAITLRVFPNTIQTASAEPTDLWYQSSLTSAFFIRPEDVPLYEGLIDILEINAEKADTQSALFQIYLQEYFDDDISFLFPEMADRWHFSNNYIPDEFCLLRIRCGKRCIKGHPCKACHHHFVVAQHLEEIAEKEEK